MISFNVIQVTPSREPETTSLLDINKRFAYISTRPRRVLMICSALARRTFRTKGAGFLCLYLQRQPDPKIERRQETMSVNVTPLHDRVLIKRIEEKETIKGGIIIPDSAKEKPQEGEVVAVGAGKINEKGDRIALDVKAGDRVLFGKYSGTEIKVENEDYLILREDEILAKLSGAAKAAGGKK
jgi:chaperonin GroES